MKLLEHGPKEILYALKKDDPAIIYRYDLENSKFTELSKNEALALVKSKSAGTLHLLIDDTLVLLEPDGKAYGTFHVTDKNKTYHDKDGDLIYYVNQMPGSHLIKIADKIYRVDFAPKQRNSITRNNNIYASTYGWPGKNSRGLRPEYHDVLYDLQNDPRKTVYNTSVAKAVQQFYHKQEQLYAQKVEQAEQAVKEYEDLLTANEGNPAKQSDIKWKLDSAEYDLQYFSRELDKIRRAIRITTNAGNDIKAAYRNAASANNLQSKLTDKIKKLQEVQRLRNKIQHAADVVDKVQKEGSDVTISRRNDLEDTKRQLAYFGNKLDNIKATLDNARADDERAIEDAMARYDEIEQQDKKVQDLVGKLARIRNKR